MKQIPRAQPENHSSNANTGEQMANEQTLTGDQAREEPVDPPQPTFAKRFRGWGWRRPVIVHTSPNVARDVETRR